MARPVTGPMKVPETDLVALLRSEGWSVASHNDYPVSNGMRTYWSFSRANQFIDGDGRDDREALMGCLMEARKLAGGK